MSRFKLSELGKAYSGLYGKSKEDFGEGENYIPYTNIYENSSIDTNKLGKVKIRKNEQQNKVQFGDIFFTTSSETIEEVGMSSVLLNELENTYLNSFCFGYRLHNFETLRPEYAQYLFRSNNIRRFISLLGQGSTRFNLPKTKLISQLELELPTNNEQTAIAHILSTVDKALEQTEKLIVKYKRIKTGLMQDLLTKGIDENGNIRSEKTHKFKESPLGSIPFEWEVQTLGEVFSEFRTGATPRRNNPNYWNNGNILWVTSGELKYKIIQDTIERITPKAVKETNLIIYPPGTFFIAITGLEAEGTRGSCALLGKAATTNQSCMAFQSNDRIDVRYLYQYYRYWGKHISLSYAQGTKQQSLNGNIVKTISIKLPNDLDEQKRIIAVFENYDTIINELQTNLGKMYHIKSGLMQDLLTGKVRVPEELIEEVNKNITKP